VVDAVCYSDTVIVKVEVFDVTAGADQTVCRNEEIQIVAGSNFEQATYEWQAPTEVTLSCTDCPDPLVTADQPGTHEIIVTLIAPTCTLSDTMQLTVLDGFAPEYEIADDAQICVGESINLGGTFVPGTTYSWTSVPPGFTSDESNPEVSPTETTTYYLEVTGIDALCPLPSTDSILVEVFELPTIAIGEDTTLCQGEPLILGATTIEEGVVYEWTGPGDIDDASNPNTVAFPQTSGTYTLTATRGACVVVESFEVEVAIIDVEILEADTLLICLGEEVDLAVNASPGGIEATWTPDDGSLSSIVGNSIVATPEVPTTYIAQVEIPGCIKQDTITILVDSLPSDLSIEPVDTTVCIGSIVVFTSPIYEPSDFQNIDFQWSPSVGFESPDSLYNLVISAQETITYTRVTTNGACTDSSTVKINVDTIPNVTISPMDTVICEGESVDIVVTADGELEEIMWMPEGGGLSCGDCLTPTATPQETTTYTMTATSGACSLSISTDVGVSDQPFLDLTTSQTICPGESLQLNFANDALTTYEWSSPDDPDFTSNDPELVVNPDQTTTYVLAATNGCGTIEDQVTITVLSGITLTAPDDQLVCSGDDITLSASSNLPDGNDATYTWEWEGGNTSIGPDLDISGITETTTFNLSFEYECGTIEEQVVITVNQAPSVTFPNNPTICFSGDLILNEDPNAALTYAWSSPDDPSFSSDEAAPVVSPDVTTTYNVVASIDGCPDFEGSVTVLVIEQASVTITMDTTICEGDQVELVAVGTAPADVPQSYTWLVDGVEVGNEATLVQTPSVDTEYTLIYNYGLDCEVLTETVMVFVEENINIDELIVVPDDGSFPIQIDIGVVDTVTAVVSPDGQNLTYIWTVDDEAYGGNTASITHTSSLGGPVTYGVTVTNDVGCTDEAAVTVEFVAPTVAVPNVFTPNGDNQNDFFFPVSSGGVEVLEMKVFNRWGQLVFDNEDLDRGWDGTFNGNPAPSDVYIYRILYKKVDTDDAEIFEEKGDVTLLR
jgi:gliding motility-associated-like protein